MIGNCRGEAPERSGPFFASVLTCGNVANVIPRIFRKQCRAAAFGGMWLHTAEPEREVFSQFRACMAA